MHTLAATAGIVIGAAAIGGIALKMGGGGSCGSCVDAPASTTTTVATSTTFAFGGPDRGVQSPGQSTKPSLHTERLGVGDTMPGFTLPTPISPDDSGSITLDAALARGPVVLTFFRGSWCPYCRGELSGIQDNLARLRELGASVVAISPERPASAIRMGKDAEIGFTVAHDENNAFARRLGLVFELDDRTIEKYKQYGIVVPRANGTDSWELPVPATYVIDRGGIVRYVYDDEDYKKRAQPNDIIRALEQIRDEG